METKHCNGCNQDKPLSEFYTRKSGRRAGEVTHRCRECTKTECKTYRDKHPEYWRVSGGYRRHPECRPMSDAPDCPSYLGIYVAEQVLSKFFDHMERTLPNTKGYDYICGKGYKIDVKSSCMLRPKNGNPLWGFHLYYNSIADWFLCLAFDNRESLNPMHVWLLPGKKFSNKSGISITNTTRGLAKWAKYERPIDNVIACCEQMRVK